MDSESISIIIGILWAAAQCVERLKKYIEKKKFEEKIEKDVTALKKDLEEFIIKVETQGNRLRKEPVFKEMLDLLARLRPLKISIVEYSKSYLNPTEKAEIKELLYTVDSIAEAILEVGKPSHLKQFANDIRVGQGLAVTYGEKSEQIRALFRRIDWKKYPKGYFKDLKKIMKEIYENGRPYDF